MIVDADIKFSRIWSMPNRETFKMKPVADLLWSYVGDGIGWIDPFAGDNSPAEYTNDLNFAAKATYHLHAIEFVQQMDVVLNGAIFDPPYSPRQVKESYSSIGLKPTKEDCQSFASVKDALAAKLDKDGLAICFGWNSNGFGKSRGFELIEVLLVAHGGNHNDTIVTVERKIID